MEKLDYRTVMEEKIKYYAMKYDPYNKLQHYKPLPPRTLEPEPIPNKRIPKVKQKLFSVLDTMASYLF